MAVHYKPIDGESVSAEWFVVLVAMRHDGVSFNVNEGHRTFARQTYFYNGWIRRLPGFNLAAYPSPNAPHIRTGRIDHAIDFSNDGAVMNWLGHHGLHPVRTVGGESWHIEVLAEALRKFAREHADPLHGLKRREHKIAGKVLYHRREVRHGRKLAANRRWARFWEKRVRAQMNAIRAVAKVRGWKGSHRGERYQILGAVLEGKIR